jgi:hypothetical protein
MQRVTKYRSAVFALALVAVGASAYAAFLHRGIGQFRDEATQADARVLASEKKLVQRDRAIDELKADLSSRGSAQTTLGLAVAAFSKQAEACEGLKQQFHCKE